MNDIAAFDLRLRFTHADEVPGWLGRAVQATFLESLSAVHPQLATHVHDGSGIKPFTASNLIPGRWSGTVTLDPRRTYQLRYTTLNPDLTRITLNALAPAWLRHGFTLHDQPVRVEAVETSTDAYAALLDRAPRQRSFRMRFTSPTQFKLTHPLHKSEGIPMPLPLPERVFGSLIDRWSCFSPLPLHPDLREWVRLNVGISDHRIETRTVRASRAGHGDFTGFIGDVTFTLLRREAPFGDQVAALVAFAPFAGVGIRTTNGMGQVAADDEPRKQP